MMKEKIIVVVNKIKNTIIVILIASVHCNMHLTVTTHFRRATMSLKPQEEEIFKKACKQVLR